MKIKLYDQPFAVVAPKEFEANNAAEWLLSYYGEAPKVTLQIYKGEPSQENDISSNVSELLKSSEDTYTVLESPGLPAAVVTFLIQVAIAVAISVVMSVLFPPPDMPGNVNRTQQSPNNSLTSRENQVRYGQRVEDIYGTVKSIPSMMMPTYYKYVDHKQKEYAYYCIGRGYYDVNALKDGDTLISDISKSGARIYAPFTSPNSGTPQQEIGEAITEKIVTVSRPEQINGITLSALNQVQLPILGTYSFFNENGATKIYQVVLPASPFSEAIEPNSRFGAILKTSSSVKVTMDDMYTSETVGLMYATDSGFVDSEDSGLFLHFDVGDSVHIQGFSNPINNGTFTIIEKDINSILVAEDTAIEDVTSITLSSGSVVNYSGIYYVDQVTEENEIIVSANNWPETLNIRQASIQVIESVDDPTPIDSYTDWVTLDDSQRTEVWVNVIARGGMFKDKGKGKLSTGCVFAVEIEKLDPATFVPTGVVENVEGYIYGQTADERAVTLEHVTSWIGPCRVRMKRVSDYDYEFEGTVIDEIKWNDLYAVTPINRLHFGNKTTIQTVSQATTRATSIKQRQLNCIASRKIPIYNGSSFSGAFDSSGAVASGYIAATSKLVDILAAVCSDPVIGNDISQLDTNQVYAVQQEMDAWDTEAGQFNYTFDSDTTSFEETIAVIANAGFCLAYRQNGKIRLAFDKLQANSSALFTHRNKKPDAETITRTFATDAEYDGVEFVYNDPTSNQSETIKLPLDESATKYKKFEIPGIRSYRQAWFRANREYQKLKGQRLSIETSCTTDARLLLPNTRIDVVDNTRFKAYDGEVVGQAGLVLTLSRDVLFTEGNHSILLMKRDGSLNSVACTAGINTNQVILTNAPAEAIVTTPGIDGIRTIFSFASDSARASQAWLVQEVGVSDGDYINIKAINYSDDYYFYDTQDVPERAAILDGVQVSSAEDFYILTEDGLVILSESNEAFIQE